MAAALIAGCATYAPLPLEKSADGYADLAQLVHDTALPDALSLDDLVRLALDNNPDLRAARGRRGIAHAELLEAGMAPNPSLNVSYGFLLGGPGAVAAVAGGFSENLQALVTLSYRRRAADQAAAAVDATQLWQEWQTVAKVRQLGVDLIEGAKRRELLADSVERLGSLAERSGAAVARGDSTLTALLPDWGARATAVQQLADVDRRRAVDQRELDALLGLQPSVRVTLRPALELPAIDAASIVAALDTLPDRRPDLIALQFGYGCEEIRVRSAILAQFPLLSLGVSGGHDNSDVRFVGPQMTVELPIFNRNQATIAIARATRQQLHDEFSARLVAARTEVRGLLTEQQWLRAQLLAKQAQKGVIAAVARRATAAYRAGDLDERTYLDALTGRDSNELDILTLEQTGLQQQIVIATLAGVGMPPLTLTRSPP